MTIWQRKKEEINSIARIEYQSFESTIVKGIYSLKTIKNNDKSVTTSAVDFEKSVSGENESLLCTIYKDNLNGFDEYYWKNMKELRPTYLAGIPNTMFIEDDDDQFKFWHPNKLGTILDLIPKNYAYGRKELCDFDGVTTSFLYIGSVGSSFGAHIEDEALFAFSYNAGPSPKVWFIIPPAFAEGFENIMKQTFPNEYEKCNGHLQHKDKIISPKFLEDNKIPYSRVSSFFLYLNENVAVITHFFN